MLMHLSVKNLALIDEVKLDFDRGLNILTGETGAGKSIIIDAVNLVLGERAHRDLIQSGKEYALVEAVFDVNNQGNIINILNEYGIGLEDDGTLILTRELSVSGKNVCRINGRMVTLSVLKDVSKYLVDIHGQHQHQSLLVVEQHRELLDRLGGDMIINAREKVERAYDAWKKTQREINRISGIGMDGERRKDILLYEINEIEEANLRQNEEEELDQERTILANGERIINTINLVYQDIYSGSNIQSSVTDLLGKASSELERIADLDPVLGQLNERIEALLFQLEDIVFDIRSYKEQFEYDPHKLDQIENRLAIIRRLKRKYGTSIQDIFSYLEVIKDELLLLENSQELLEELMKKEKKLFFDLLESCRVLTNQRKKVAKFFEQQLLEQLGELGMDKSSFVVNIDSAEDVDLELSYLIGKITPKGYDDIEFMISTNPGEPVKPLSRIISGGEMSRVMLAFKTILAQLDDIPTLIFDEIDAGISGRIAHVVGEKMGSISRSRQVICVTHLPQIAAMADSHYKIEKIFMDGHTRTTVCKLDYMQRQEEIAKMTGGKTLSKASLEHSSELIRIAKEYKNGLG